MELYDGMIYVYTVYKEKSFTSAAKKLFISQPSLSASVRRIEDKLGYPIFDRTTKPVALTEYGKKYIESIERIMAIENDFTDYLNDTFDAGGRAAILLWRGFELWHWMGAMREKGRIRIMDPATGTYEPFVRGIRHYGTAGRQPHFLVFGFVRD